MRKMPWLLVLRLPIWRRRVLTLYVSLERN
jgi:hypothetical protein